MSEEKAEKALPLTEDRKSVSDSEPSLPKHSISYGQYFAALGEEVKRIYEVAERARAKGVDPSPKVEIPPAHDVAARVEATLDGPVGVAKRIRELQLKLSREEVAFAVAREIAAGELGGITDPEKAADKAVRVALAIMTESITAAPLEGIARVRIRGSGDEQYLALYLAGPIRAAGGTDAAMTVLVADQVRQVLGLPSLKATPEEIERSVEEVELYSRASHLQYPVHPDLIRFAASRLPILLTGEPTEEYEVSGGRDLERIETNRVRSGFVLVLSDGVVGRSPKLAKIVNRLRITGWDWLTELAAKTSKARSSEAEESIQKKLAPKPEYLADVIGGRPVFAHPSRVGGFRLRYGRSRNTGLAGVGIHPATMFVVDEFLATGTHIRTERPGKGSIVAPVDTVEGPIVLLKDGTVKQIYDIEEARRLQGKVERILFLGDILVAMGEFLENNHPLVPSGYCEEWWSHDLERACSRLQDIQLKKRLSDAGILPEELTAFIELPLSKIPTPHQALRLSEQFRVPLHPRYQYRWSVLAPDELLRLRDWLLSKKSRTSHSEGELIVVPNDTQYKSLLERIGMPHRVSSDNKHLELTDSSLTILAQLGPKSKSPSGKDSMELLASVADVPLRDKLGFSIGARMGRPEKAEERKMHPPVHVLFPVGRTLASERRLEKVAGAAQHISALGSLDYETDSYSPPSKASGSEIELVSRVCPRCKSETFESRCPKCLSHTEIRRWCSQEGCGRLIDETTGMCPLSHDVNMVRATKKVRVDIQWLLDRVKTEAGEPQSYGLRGVLGLTNELKIPEYLGKGILRAKHTVYCYRDGTARFDATDAPLTHFTPREIGVPVARLREMGYLTDYRGEPLDSDEQVVELKVQDLVVSENCIEYLYRVGCFVDDCLEKVYGVERFYRFESQDDVVGHLVIGLAPHTSAGIIGRIIGSTNASVCYAHPYYHAAKRRNCFPADTTIDVEIDGIIQRITVRELFEEYFEDETVENGIAIRSRPKGIIKALSIDTETGETKMTPVVDAVRLPSTDHLITFNLKLGRSFTTTPDHPVIVCEDDQLVEKRASEVKEQDRMVVPRIDVPEANVESIDLLKEFAKPSFSFLQDACAIRGIRSFTKGLIHRKGLAETAQELYISKKTLSDCYGERDSVPLSILLRLLGMHSLTVDDVSDCKIGFKRNETFVNRHLPINNAFMRLAGYFLSEGFYREGKDTYQLDLAVSQDDLRDDMMRCIREVFGDGFNPYINESRITVSNRTIMHVFRDVIGFKPTARGKRVPPFMFKLPLPKVADLVSAFFSGAGGVDVDRRTVDCTSFSRDLLVDFDFLLRRFGIFASLSTTVRGENLEHKLRIRGENVVTYEKEIGFVSGRKAESLREAVLGLDGIVRKQEMSGPNRLVAVTKVTIDPSTEQYVYSLNASTYHTVLVNDHVLTHQCDGDEDALLLVMDALINFSRSYLPAGRGGFMDAPLVLSVILNPSEVDSEAHNLDVCTRFPAQFFEFAAQSRHPKEAEHLVDIVASRLSTEAQYEGFGFTHGTSSIDAGPRNTRYKLLGSMDEKLDAQLRLAGLIDAVDARDVAERVLSHHFIRDIRGNLRAYSTQKIQCVRCHRIYRRIPLSGKCECGSGLSLTVRRKNISKYLPIAQRIIEEHNLGQYLKDGLELINSAIDSLFLSEQTSLADFL